MSKIDQIIESNAEIRSDYKTLTSLIKYFISGFSVVIVLFITFMIQTRDDIATIKATLVTSDNIYTLKKDIDKIGSTLDNYILFSDYSNIENGRALIITDAIYELGNRVDLSADELFRLKESLKLKLEHQITLHKKKD